MDEVACGVSLLMMSTHLRSMLVHFVTGRQIPIDRMILLIWAYFWKFAVSE